MQAGLVGLKGPGVVITLDDSEQVRPCGAEAYFYIVHAVDLQALVNELWATGAEAICINDQRVVNRTAIGSAGPTILVNGKRMSPPYEVQAIGPAEELSASLEMPGGVLDSMGMLLKCGGQVSLARANEVEIPPYTGSLAYRYARPVTR